MIIHLNTVKRLRVRYVIRGEPEDPDNVRVQITTPVKTEHVFAYGRDPGLKRLSRGHYWLDVLSDRPGIWHYAWTADDWPDVTGAWAVAEDEDDHV